MIQSPPDNRKAAAALAGLLVLGRLVRAEKAHNRAMTHALLKASLPNARRLYRRMKANTASTQKANLDGLPVALRWLIQSMIDMIGDWFTNLEQGDSTVGEWVERMREAVAEFHLAAFMAGNGAEIVPEKAFDGLVDQVNVQLEYLTGFQAQVQAAPEFAAGWQTRAESYAAAIKVPYWTGKTKVLPLPAMPAQGTQCGNNCKCLWRVVTLDEAAGNYDAYWERHFDDSCQTCVQREEEWSPVRIRDGMLE